MSSSQSTSRNFQFNHTQQQQQQQQSSPSKANGNNNTKTIHLQSRSGFQPYFSSSVGTAASSTSNNNKSNKKDSLNLINQLNSSVQSHQQQPFHLQGPHVGTTGRNNNNVLYNNKTGASVTTATIPQGSVITSGSGPGGKKGQSVTISSQNNKALVTNGVHKTNNNVQKGKTGIVKSHPRVLDTKGSSGIRNDSKTASHQSAAPQTSVPLSSPSASSPEKSFKTGDDVLFNAEDGSMVFGTVGMIHGQTLQILFGDGTQQWASFKRVTNFSASVPSAEEESEYPESKGKGKQSKYNKTANSDTDQTSSSEEVTCGSCGTVKRVAGKKALNYHPYTSHQFNCRRCLNKSSFSKNSMIISPGSRGRTNHQNSTIKSEHQGHGRLVGDMGEVNRRSDDECFHCKGKTSYNDRLHCNLCERACHLSCLAISPTPLEGDRFWDVICSACGTQNGDSGAGGTKVFSCRRSISSWSDVAHLVLSCLGIQQGEKFFDLDMHIIPFIDSHMDRLHLPRSYKTKQAEDRKTFLRTALNNAKLRFVNIQDSYGKLTLWAITDNNNHQGYPYRSSIQSRPPSTSPIPGFQSASTCSSNVNAFNKVQTPQSSPLLNVGGSIGNSAKLKVSAATTSSSVKSQSTSSPSKPSSAYSTTNISNSADIQSRIIASIPKTILNAKQNRNGTVGVGGAFSSVNNLSIGSSSTGGGLSGHCTNAVPTSTQPFRALQSTEDQLAAGSSRTLGKGSPKKILPPNLPGVTLTSVTSHCTSEVDPRALDTAVEQSRQIGVKRTATAATIALRKDISISIIRPDDDSNNTNSTESGMGRDDSDSDSDSDQNNGLKMMNHNFGTKRKISVENILGLEDELSKKKQKLALDLPGFKTPVKQSSQPNEYVYDVSPGVELSPVNSSPISEKMSNIFKNLSGATNLISRSFPKPSPTESISPKDISPSSKTPCATVATEKDSNSGKAVKSASITPPGRNIKSFQSKDKPHLRIRKPKALQVLTSKVTKKAKESGSGMSSTKVSGAELRKKSAFSINRGRGRGRPLKGPTISNLNGILVQPPPEVDDTINTNEYNVMNATVEDLIKYGKGITMQCLPKAPSSTLDLVNVASKYLLMEEKPSPPSFWSSDDSKCNKWQRSKRDLKNLDSYEITGRMVLPDGTVKYLCSWKDGYGNSEINEEDLPNESYYQVFDEITDDDLSDPSALQHIVDNLDTDEEDGEELSANTNAAGVAPLIPKVEPISPKQSGNYIKSKKSARKANSTGTGNRSSSDSSSLDKDTFLVSGLGLRKKLRKENSQPEKPMQKKVDEIIDLTADSP